MQCVKKSVLVPYAAAEMFELVDRVDQYPQFLPWCAGAQVLEATERRKTARLDIDYHGVRAQFTTDNVNEPPALIIITLRSGPFRQLHGEWRFRALDANACKVEFDLRYEFASQILERIVGPVFNHIANTFVEAFVKRAETTKKRRK